MKKLFIILLLPLTLLAAPAPSTINLVLDLPTTNTDNSVLTDLASVQVWCSMITGGPYILMEQEVNVPPAPVLTDSVTITATNCMAGAYGSVYFVTTATNSSGFVSSNGNEITRTYVDERIPNPPRNLRFL